jgi:hypothetical protein
MWITIIRFRGDTRYLAKNRLTGSLDKAVRFASKKQAQRAYQEFSRENSRELGTCSVSFERTEEPATAAAPG